jgi:hypothetical protein
MRRLLVVLIVIGCIWGIVLPRAADTDTVRARTRWLREHDIDPAAMYYTELPLMERVLRERSAPHLPTKSAR